MASVLLFVFVGVVAFVWIRGARRNRERWLRQLALVGVWDLDSPELGVVNIEFRGGLSEGTFVARADGDTEQGTWRLTGNTLVLEAGVAKEYDLRFFDSGKIGIDGPDRERQVYLKRRDNVVPLRRSS